MRKQTVLGVALLIGLGGLAVHAVAGTSAEDQKAIDRARANTLSRIDGRVNLPGRTPEGQAAISSWAAANRKATEDLYSSSGKSPGQKQKILGEVGKEIDTAYFADAAWLSRKKALAVIVQRCRTASWASPTDKANVDTASRSYDHDIVMVETNLAPGSKSVFDAANKWMTDTTAIWTKLDAAPRAAQPPSDKAAADFQASVDRLAKQEADFKAGKTPMKVIPGAKPTR